MICVLSILNSYGRKHKYYTFETELGDTFTLEVYLSGNMHGMNPNYLVYDGDDSNGKEFGVVLYVDNDEEQVGCFPEDPVGSITTVGLYGKQILKPAAGSESQ